MKPIITSLLETDAYKFSMGQAIYHQFSDYKTTWSFKCRNEDVHFTPEMVEEIKNQIKMYCDLRFKEDELEYLNNIKWIKGSYVDFLRLWKPRFDDFVFGTDAECGSVCTAGADSPAVSFTVSAGTVSAGMLFGDSVSLSKEGGVPVSVAVSSSGVGISFVSSVLCSVTDGTERLSGTDSVSVSVIREPVSAGGSSSPRRSHRREAAAKRTISVPRINARGRDIPRFFLSAGSSGGAGKNSSGGGVNSGPGA